MILLPNFHKSAFPINEFATSKEFVLKNFGGLHSTLLDKKAYECFSSWLKFAPKLNQDDFPYTYAYIEDEQNKNVEKMAQELKDIDIFLSENEVIYHGGIFPISDVRIGDTFSTFKFFSTTIDSYTASFHAIQEEEVCLWIIKLNKPTRAFPTMLEWQEESELLILDELQLKVSDIQNLKRTDDMAIERHMKCIFLEQII